MIILDGFGKACPMPLMMCKKAIEQGAHELAIQVDNQTAVRNILRLGEKMAMSAQVDEIEGGWLISLAKGSEADAVSSSDSAVEAPFPGP